MWPVSGLCCASDSLNVCAADEVRTEREGEWEFARERGQLRAHRRRVSTAKHGVQCRWRGGGGKATAASRALDPSTGGQGDCFGEGSKGEQSSWG